MKSPRFSISGLMALVLLVAMDFGICKALMGGSFPFRDLADLIVYGVLPMANILALGMGYLVKSRPEGSVRRSGLLGFEVLGMAALLIFLVCSSLLTRTIHEGVGHLLRAMGMRPGPTFLAGAVAILLLPQMALALFGGWLWRNYKFRVVVVVERRGQAEPGPILERLDVAEVV